MRNVLRLCLGLALVLHGLGNAVLPLRALDATGPGPWLPVLTLVWVVAIVGFAAAGLGVLGVPPFDRVVIAASFVAAGCSLLGYARLAALDLWPGVLLSVTLPMATTGWVRSQPTAPAAASRHRWIRRAIDAVGLAVFAWIAASALLWPWHRGWGTDRQDWTLALPGDKSPRNPAMEILHRVSIDVPPSAVWPWLVQLGQDRAGFYSYDRLERLAGVHVHNVREIRPEWQSRQVGDRVYATQPGYIGGLFGERPGWMVDVVEPNHALVLRYWGAFVLEPAANGGTRFLIRSTITNPDIPAWAAALNFTAFELPHFIMQRRMMLSIKELAEQQAASSRPAPAHPEL